MTNELKVPRPARGEGPVNYALRAFASALLPPREFPNKLEHACGWNVTFIDEKREEATKLYDEHVEGCNR